EPEFVRRMQPRAEELLEQLPQRERRRVEPKLARERLELALQLLRSRLPIVAIARKRLQHDALELLGIALAHAARRLDLPAGDPVHDLEVVAPREQAESGRDLVEEDPRREHVAAPIEVEPVALLGRHVPALAPERARLRG